MINSERNFAKLIKEICKEEDIKLKSFSDNWIFRLTKDNLTRNILGYRFELNSSAVDRICNDKCATSEILIDNNINTVEHEFFFSASNTKYLSDSSNWELMLKRLEEYKVLVLKPNEGTGGNNVFRVRNKTELEVAYNKIFLSSRSLALCPFYEIEDEYRVIVLDNEIKLIYRKEIPFIMGNGKDNILKLISNSKIKHKLDDDINYYKIPENNEKVKLNWKHNLGLGAEGEEVKDKILREKLSSLALTTSNVLNIKFASIDIIKINNELKVLEINSGVMLDNFSSFSEKNYNLAKEIYKEAIDLMFKN